jgi:SAM-dependent methyltransferase
MESKAYEELHRLEPTHWWYRGMRQITERLLQAPLEHQEKLRILDAGCGTGGNMLALAERGTAVGVDFSPLALEYASETHPGKVAQASVERLPFADNSFDLVTSFDVLYCYEVRDDVKALREFARVLCPGGHLFIRLPALPFLRGSHDIVVHGIRRYTASELHLKLLQAGLRPVRLTYLNCLLLPGIFLIRKMQNVCAYFGAAPDSDVQETAPALNSLLTRILTLEAAWISHGHDFPAGVSVACIATKPVST